MHAAEGKRTELAFQRWRAEILREAHDQPSLSRVAARALSDSEVRADGALTSMIQAFINEQEAGLRVAQRAAAVAREAAAQATSAVPAAMTPQEEARDDPAALFAHLEREFHEQVSRYHLGRARDVLLQAAELGRACPDAIPLERIESLSSDLELHERRADAYRHHVGQLADRAAAAARKGDEQAVGRTLRRLSIIHAARPMLLGDAEFQQIRGRIADASEDREHRVAAHLLIQRERAVAAEIRQLSEIIHRFYRVARSVPHDHPDYVEAERAYADAVRQVQAHDAEWLAALILELVDLLEEWHTPSPDAQVRVDRFLASVKKALRQLRREIHAIDETVRGARVAEPQA